MWLTAGYVAYILSHWLTWKFRRAMFRRAVSKVIQGCSIVVQKSPDGFHDLLRSLQLPHPADINIFMKGKKTNFISLTPKLEVSLNDWTSYYALKEHQHTEGGEENINVLLEATRPLDRGEFFQHEFSVPVAAKVHASSHGTAVAWRAGPPFGILMHCSLEEYTTLCLAYCDGDLTLDEDLVVQRIVSVNTKGSSVALVKEESVTEEDTREREREGSRPDIHAMLLKSQKERLGDTLSCDWSNESLASGVSMGTSDFLDLTDAADAARRFSENCSIQGEEEDEGGSGEAPCEIESQFLPTVESIQRTGSMKPPNILIYCGKKDSSRKFQGVKSALELCVNPECYAIYHLKHDQVTKVPWADNSALLVLSCDSLYDGVTDAFTRYFDCGGRVLSFGSPFDAVFVARQELFNESPKVMKLNFKSWKDVNLLGGRYCYVPHDVTGENVTLSVLGTNQNEEPVILDVKAKSQQHAGHAVISQVLLDHDPTEYATSSEVFNLVKQSNATRLDVLKSLLSSMDIDTENTSVPVLTPSYLLTRDQTIKDKFLQAVKPQLKNTGVLKSPSVSLHFMTKPPNSAVEVDMLPLVTEAEADFEFFSEKTYWDNWTGSVLGNTLMVTDVLPTTIPLFDMLQFSVPADVGLVAVAGRQTSGKGRGGNAWLSPIGCGMFSLHVRLPLNSNLGRSASFLQHITSLAVVQSVRKLPGYQDIDLRLKWPNDIYYSNKMKLGGVLVKSTVMDNTLHANIGCGFNVSNKNPTICINDLIEHYNTEQGKALPLCSTSQLIAITVSNIEKYIEEFQQNGSHSFLQEYYSRWLHRDQRVTVESEGVEATVVGLDQYGFLEVLTDQGRKLTLQPDGNTFDMMRNLITMKSN